MIKVSEESAGKETRKTQKRRGKGKTQTQTRKDTQRGRHRKEEIRTDRRRREEDTGKRKHRHRQGKTEREKDRQGKLKRRQTGEGTATGKEGHRRNRAPGEQSSGAWAKGGGGGRIGGKDPKSGQRNRILLFVCFLFRCVPRCFSVLLLVVLSTFLRPLTLFLSLPVEDCWICVGT